MNNYLIIKSKTLFNKSWFTFTELIIVIMVIAILSIISLSSYNSYIWIVRDSARLEEMNNIETWLHSYNMISWFYPLPSNSLDITYSWAIVWRQWTFWSSVSSMIWYSNNTYDQHTQKEYTYSIKNTWTEFSLVWVLEEHTSILWWYSNNKKLYANESKTKTWYAIVKWNYNWLILSVAFNDTTNILALPSIITSDISNLDLEYIIDNNKLVCNNNTNLPASYSGTVYNMNSNLDFSTNNLIVFSWSVNDLKNTSNQIKLLRDIYLAYSWSILWDSIAISTLNNTDLFSENPSNYIKEKAYNMVNYTLNYNLD